MTRRDSLKGNGTRAAARPETLAEILFYLPKPELRRELEAFRVEWEQANGPTDLTRNYTSMWSQEDQDWLFKADPKRFFDGLPPFAQDYLRTKMRRAARAGNLDDQPETCLRLFVQGLMREESDLPGRW